MNNPHRSSEIVTRPRKQPVRIARSLSVAAISLAMLALLLAVAGCGSRRQPEDPYARYRPAMKAEFQPYLDEMETAPQYALTVELDPEESLLTGNATIQVTNYSSEPWNELVFRLYPMLDHYKGNLLVRGVTVDGAPVSFNYLNSNTAIKVNLADPLDPSDSAEVRMIWRLEYPTWSDSSRVYVLYGKSQEMISLPLFYPSLAVFEDGPVPGTGAWWRDEGTVRGDSAYNVSSLFVVTATMPADQVPVTSGTLITETQVADGKIQRVWATGPSREFLLHTSPNFKSAQIETEGTRITSYWLPGEEAAGRAALRYTAAALRIYSDRFGEYPFRDLRVAPAPTNFRGMEYPQVSLMGVELYNRERWELEPLVAHEVAHQWWYQMVHNDQVESPWLDEALAEYSMKLYIQDIYGDTQAGYLQNDRWEEPLDILREAGGDAPVDQPVEDFGSGQYETLVYGKGALFYDALYDRLGDRRFNNFLRDYLNNHRFEIVDVDDWLADLQALDEPGLVELYKEWIQSPRPTVSEPVPTPEPQAEDSGIGEGENK